MRHFKSLVAGAALAVGVAGAAHAAFPVYPNPGTENPTAYTFTATVTGDLVAYFAGADAGDTEDLGLFLAGSDQGAGVFPNHFTPIGTSFNFGHVTAGQSLMFYIVDHNIGTNWYSDPSLNPGGFNAVYSTHYTGGDHGIPAGTFVAFEDRGAGGDRDYNDETFVFTNVSSGAPEPMTWTMMIMGFGAAGAMLRRRGTVAA